MPGLTVPTPREPTILQPSETENQLVQGYQKTSTEGLARADRLREEKDAVAQDISSMEFPAPPKTDPIPQFQAAEFDRDGAMLFGNLALGIAAIATKSQRGDLALALNTAGSAMKGFNEGNLQQAAQERENFTVKMRSIIANNEMMLREYDAVMKDRKLTLAQKQQRYQVLATRYQDELALTAIKKGDIRFLLDREQRLREGNQKLEMRVTELNNKWAMDFERLALAKLRSDAANPEAGTAGLTPEAIDMLAREAIKDKGVLANLGRGVQGARDLRAITNRMAEMVATDGGPGMAQRRQEFRADSNSLNKLTMQYDAITAFEKTAIRNGHVLVDLAEKVDVTGMPVAERWIRAGRRSIAGDPDVAMFNTQMTLFRAEAARILTNPNLTGTLTVHAQQEAESFLNGADSAAQISRVVSLLERDFKAREVTIVEQMDSIRDRMVKGYAAGTPGGGGGQQPPGAQNVQRSTSRSGRPIVSMDGGKTWVYE